MPPSSLEKLGSRMQHQSLALLSTLLLPGQTHLHLLFWAMQPLGMKVSSQPLSGGWKHRCRVGLDSLHVEDGDQCSR